MTPRDHDLFCDMLAHAFMEIRSLSQRGKADQVAALGYALHDVPHLLTLQGEERLVRGWSEVRERLESYQGDYPREAGAYWDYLGMLNLIDRPA